MSAVNHYLGGLSDKSDRRVSWPSSLKFSRKNRIVLINPIQDDDIIQRNALTQIKSIFSGMREPLVVSLFKYYVLPIVQVYKEVGLRRRFAVIVGDNRRRVEFPAFCKTRPIDEPANGVILPLKWDRHFGRITEVEKFDMSWHAKLSKLVWRGSTTGRFSEPDLGSRYYIAKINLNISNSGIDVGYSNITASLRRSKPECFSDVLRAKRESLGISTLLKYKYLLCLEGNDVASGLKWMLFSNSLVLMPRPKIEGWGREDQLRESQHFVRVKHDLSDLEAVLNWCQANESTCERIAKNATDLFLRNVWTYDADDMFRTICQRYDDQVLITE